MYCGHARLCVCLSAAICPHYCTDPDVTWGRSRGCPVVVHYWADLQPGHGLCCYGNITRTRTLVTSLRPSRDMTTVRTLGGVCARCWPVTGGVLKIVHRIWEVGVAGWPATGRRRGAFSFSTLLWRPALRASTGGVLVT